MAADSGEAVIYGMQENLPLKVSAGGSLIFSGLVTYARVSGMGGTYYVEAEGRTRSILMDQEQHSRSFQDVNMTYKQLVKAILSEYPEAEVSYSIPDVPIKEIAVQYRETDWQFLKRMLSMLHAPLACNPAGETIQLYAGVPEIPYRDWGYEITGFRKEMGEFQYWQQSGMGRGDDCFQVAELQTGCKIGRASCRERVSHQV